MINKNAIKVYMVILNRTALKNFHKISKGKMLVSQNINKYYMKVMNVKL